MAQPTRTTRSRTSAPGTPLRVPYDVEREGLTDADVRVWRTRPHGQGVGPGAPRRRLPRDPRTRAALVTLAVVLVALAVAAGVRLAHAGEVLPGTSVAGVELAGTDARTAAARIAPAVSDRRDVRVRGAGRTQRLTLAELGHRPDVPATARDAMRAGRDGVLGGVPATLLGLVATRDVPVRASVDRGRLRDAVGRIADGRDAATDPGSLRVDPSTREVRTTPPRAGRRVDRDALAAELAETARTGRTDPIDVPARRVPAPSADDLARVAEDARAYLRRPLRLRGSGPATVLGGAELAPLLALDVAADGRTARLGVQDATLRTVLDRAARAAGRPARDARLGGVDAEPTMTAKGAVTWRPRPVRATVEPARPGRAVRRDALAARIRAAVARGDHDVRIPTARSAPALSTQAAGRVDALLGTFTTPFVGGQPRVVNIARMAEQVDGTVVPAGGRFSLNAISGERTEAKGYVRAPYIVGNRLEDSVGGGVSQVGTTAYNAAFFAGLPIEAHRAHSLYIDRYPAGREATLNFPDLDVAWTNDTGAPIVVRARAAADSLTVAIYGTDTGRRVRASIEGDVPAPGTAGEVTVRRTIERRGGTSTTTASTTTYEDEVVAQADEGTAPAPATSTRSEAAAGADPGASGQDGTSG